LAILFAHAEIDRFDPGVDVPVLPLLLELLLAKSWAMF